MTIIDVTEQEIWGLLKHNRQYMGRGLPVFRAHSGRRIEAVSH